MSGEAKARIRCAIYTRKSSEEGLDQSFNSLDAQREACRAFITSQKHEGWRPLPALYDDGGYSGGTIERPALKRLMEDIQAGQIDAVVVYKVDRLTRSLADFAKIIEIFDAHHVSFVSITQQFNTTTSMGRLTLNVLLSFAQFEREVTGERIRDKIAASKSKGMWMGGNVPLGYDLKDRKLVVNASEAATVRHIFSQYLKLGCVSKLKGKLQRSGIKSKERTSRAGRKTGGAVYSRGALYSILQNRIYRGEIEHKGQIYAGEHDAIITTDQWERVQAQLRSNNHAHQNGLRAATPSLLVGLVFDEHGNRFTPAHAMKNGRRYRYYVSQAAIRNPGAAHDRPVRIPAVELEGLVRSRLQSLLASQHQVIALLALERLGAAGLRKSLAAATELSKRVLQSDAETSEIIRKIVSRITILTARVEITLDRQFLRKALCAAHDSNRQLGQDQFDRFFKLSLEGQLKRCGSEARFVLPPNSREEMPARLDHPLIKAVARAYGWYERVLRHKVGNTNAIAEAVGLDGRYVRHIFRCAFLAPDIVQSILDGQQPPALTLENLKGHIPMDWASQRRSLGLVGQ